MKAYLTINHGDTHLGTLRLTLRPDIVPRTVDNFVHFLTTTTTTTASTSDNSSSTRNNNNKGYCNSTFHRIIPKFMAQGGDFLNHNGTGSTSIYGSSFPDENFQLSHSQRGTLSMANSGKDTNGCQFFITFKPTAHLDGRHVVFGYVDWRDDDESDRVLEKLERVRTERGDKPLIPVRIVDCGVIDEGKKKNKGSEASGSGKLVGEAKKNKLLQAYGDNPAAVDEDEIDLDDDDNSDEVEDGPKNDNRDETSSSKVAGDKDEIDLDDENDDDDDQVDASNSAEPPTTGKLSKKAALKKRLATLRTKINQSRTLNRREVHAEATRMGTDEASIQHRKIQNKQDKLQKQKEYDTYVTGKLRNTSGEKDETTVGGSRESKAEQKKMASLSQPAYDSIREMTARADKREMAQHGVNDYFNPEGQYANYERNMKSVRHARKGGAYSAVGNTTSGVLDSYDPTLTNDPNNATANRQASISGKEGAKRLADEMKRRAEKRNNKKRKVEFDAEDITSINERNKRFNQKISRNFDQHTAEIRQNLERGTAL